MKLKTQSGFTLIEIMVALAIGAFLMSGIFQVFVSLKYTDKISTSLSRIQESGRTAVNIMAQEIRLAGYKGCADPSVVGNVNIIANNAPTTNFLNEALRGFDVSATGWASAAADLASIDGSDIGQARLNSDVISVMHSSSESVGINDHDNTNANIKVLANPLGLEKGNIAVVSDCHNMDIFRISNTTAGSGTEVNFTHSIGSYNSDNNLQTQYTTDEAQLMSLVANTFFVGDTGRSNAQGDPIYALYRKNINDNIEEIVEGVEYLHVSYGEEFSNSYRRFVSATGNAVNMLAVVSVKLSIMVTSNDRVLEADDTNYYPMADVVIQPEAAGGTFTYPNDRRLRKVFDMTVNLRNRRVEI